MASSVGNIVLAIVLGLLVDDLVARVKIDPLGRILLQIVIIVAIVNTLDRVYIKLIDKTLSSDSVFFISVFLGVQVNLFNNITEVYGRVKRR